MFEIISSYLPYIEIAIIGIFILLQFIYTAQTRKEAQVLEQIFHQSNLAVIYGTFPEQEAVALDKAALANLIYAADAGHGDKVEFAEPEIPDIDDAAEGNEWLENLTNILSQQRIEVTLLKPLRRPNKLFKDIINDLNLYLLRSKHNQIDFGIVKDIIERECDNQEEKVYNGIQMPLYLGLLGTILGIVIGLAVLLLPSASEVESTLGLIGGGKVNKLLMAVSIAMFGSFTGLWLTIRSTLAHKKGIAVLNKGKHNFYHFLQTELLPTLPKTMAGTVEKLQLTLEGFNTGFSKNLKTFDSNIEAVHSNLATQQSFLNQLANLDLNEIVQGNIKVFQELTKGAGHFKQFLTYQESLNFTIDKVNNASNQLSKVGDRMQTIIQELEFIKNSSSIVVDTIGEQQKMFQNFNTLLDNDTSIIEEWKVRIRKEVEDLDKIMQDNMEALGEHSSSHFENVKKVMDTQFIHLQKVFEDSQSKFKHFDQLQHLSKLDDIKQALSKSNNPQLNEKLGDLHKIQTQTNELLAAILKHQQKEPLIPGLLKKLGYGKKKK